MMMMMMIIIVTSCSIVHCDVQLTLRNFGVVVRLFGASVSIEIMNKLIFDVSNTRK